MSKEFLKYLNGNNNGAFRRWLDRIEGEPRIAWYPSAGQDFRDLLFLHPHYACIKPGSEPDPFSPDIFLHTDYYPWGSGPSFLNDKMAHRDGNTEITIASIEELPRCDLPLDSKIVHFPDGGEATGRVFFMEFDVKSDRLGHFFAPVLYAFVENSAFCAKYLLPHQAALSHIVHVRYGNGFGGSNATGVWLLNVLQKLQCECFITDGHHNRQSGDSRVYELYPELDGDENEHQLRRIRLIPAASWSYHGDVSWNIIGSRVYESPRDLAASIRGNDWSSERHVDSKGRLHRDQGPALIKADGSKLWFDHGRFHRVGGPAIIRANGREEWLIYGKLHRVGGPAIVSPNYELWCQHGRRHRTDGPASIFRNRDCHWYVNGQSYCKASQYQKATGLSDEEMTLLLSKYTGLK